MSVQKPIGFWQWFLLGSGGKSGFRTIINLWLLLHIIIGIGLAYIIKIDIATAANTVLLPLVGILIGLCFAWAGNAQALLQSSELSKMTGYHKGGFAQYVYTYQTAIFTILVTLVFWALAGFRIFDDTWPTPCCRLYYFGVESFLFTLSSLTLRECWHVVLGSQWLLLTQHTITKFENNEKNP